MPQTAARSVLCCTLLYVKSTQRHFLAFRVPTFLCRTRDGTSPSMSCSVDCACPHHTEALIAVLRRVAVWYNRLAHFKLAKSHQDKVSQTRWCASSPQGTMVIWPVIPQQTLSSTLSSRQLP